MTNNIKSQKQIFAGFIPEWDERQSKVMRIAIRNHFGRKGANTMHHGHIVFNSFAQLDSCFGLAYTSSSSYAMYSICNTEVYLDAEKKYHYNHFSIGKDGKYYAILWDKDENELIIEL